MWPTLINVGGFALNGWVLAVVGVLFFTSFYWWRSMRLDCDEELIFGGTLGLYFWLGITSYLAAKIIKPEMGMVWFLGLGFWWWFSARKKWDYWEWVDVIVPGGLVAGIVINLAIGPSRLVYAAAYTLVWLLARWVAKNYRKIKWYLSGRIGFSGLVGLAFWSIAEVVVEMWQGNRIYWLGLTVGQWFAVVILTVSFTAIYLRSGRKITRDLPFLANQKHEQKK